MLFALCYTQMHLLLLVLTILFIYIRILVAHTEPELGWQLVKKERKD